MIYEDTLDFCQEQPDGTLDCGDCAKWMGDHVYNYNTNYHYAETFEVGLTGGYVRHPSVARTNYAFGAYYKGVWDGCITRDQLSGIIAALITAKLRGNPRAFERMFKHTKERGFLFSYSRVKRGEDIRDGVERIPDLLGPETWQMLIRGKYMDGGVVSAVMLYLCDCWMLLATIYDRLSEDNDNITYLVQMFVMRDIRPTIIGTLCVRIMSLDQQLRKLDSYWRGWRDKGFMVEGYVKKLIEIGVR